MHLTLTSKSTSVPRGTAEVGVARQLVVTRREDLHASSLGSADTLVRNPMRRWQERTQCRRVASHIWPADDLGYHCPGRVDRRMRQITRADRGVQQRQSTIQVQMGGVQLVAKSSVSSIQPISMQNQVLMVEGLSGDSGVGSSVVSLRTNIGCDSNVPVRGGVQLPVLSTKTC